MKISRENINCSQYWKDTKRAKIFSAVKYSFDYYNDSDDRELLDVLIKKGKDLAANVNQGAANDSVTSRPYKKILNNCVAGVVAEFCWQNFLNDAGKVSRVSETDYTDATNQIDLKVLITGQTIEVRSSFPRNGIPFALCHPTSQFDVIGPYSNSYKPGEVAKDFYVRTLFHLRQTGFTKSSAGVKYPVIETILEKIYEPSFEVFLTGGATWLMMIDESISKVKSFIPEDEMDISRLKTASNYRVVAFQNSLDTIEIHKLIKQIS